MAIILMSPPLLRILHLLQDAGDNGITARDIINKAKFLQYNRAIFALRKLHYQIDCEMKSAKNEYDESVTYWVYTLR